MSENIQQCHQCKNSFSEQEVYRIGIKQKHFYCRECAKNIKSECMWCGKELAEKKWKRLGGGSGIKSEEGKLAETIDRDNFSSEKHCKYYLTCEETREHGMRPNQSCPSRVNDWWVEKGNQRRKEKASKGWKECLGKAVYFKDPKNGEVLFDMKCWKLVPPGQKYCKDECCAYYTAVCNGTVSDKEKRIKTRWEQRDQEKYQRANEWWNSLSLAEKQAKLKVEKERLKNLGLQRQRCWVENIDKNSILFENGELYYENMNKIPPSFLHEFGLPGYRWENVWKNEGNHSNAISHKVELSKEINQKEGELKYAKEEGDNRLVAHLEKQLSELKSQQQSKNNSLVEKNSRPKNDLTPWIIAGGLVAVLGGLIFWIWKKNSKTKL